MVLSVLFIHTLIFFKANMRRASTIVEVGIPRHLVYTLFCPVWYRNGVSINLILQYGLKVHAFTVDFCAVSSDLWFVSIPL